MIKSTKPDEKVAAAIASREAVEVAIDRAKNDKGGTWETVVRRQNGKVPHWGPQATESADSDA
jgi:hypothetical protein